MVAELCRLIILLDLNHWFLDQEEQIIEDGRTGSSQVQNSKFLQDFYEWYLFLFLSFLE